MGNEKALKIYCFLVEHTSRIIKNIDATRIIYYSEYLCCGDAWDSTYLKTIQQGSDLGERMANAFEEQLRNQFGKAVLIGSDCYELTSQIIQDAFDRLDQFDVVIGPALDGGYYLIGMKIPHQELFDKMVWSTASVLQETRSRCDELGLRCFLLPTLSDIDVEEDLLHTGILEKL